MANEQRLIDANALLEKIQFRRPAIDTETKIVSDCVQIVRKDIVAAPTVDAVSRGVHDQVRWERDVDTYDAIVDYSAFNYCPNCGAKMDGGNEDA